MATQDLHVPLAERLKAIPGFFGVHLNETPKYTVLRRDGEVELREYDPMLVAMTTVQGTGEEPKNQAFTKLAGYIFGENAASQTLHMTSPVLIHSEDGRTVMSFVMPAKLTGKTVPLPNDQSIHIQEVPTETWAVIGYSVANDHSDDSIDKRNALESWLTLHEFPLDYSTCRIAQYDSPTTIPLLRRNEVQFRVYRAKM